MSSPFWTYFHDKLNWFPIFRPGPVSALMKGLALHMDEVREDILWLRKQWNPLTCEKDLVEKYGISRGVPRIRFDTDESYRKRVAYAYAWHKMGGKIRGLEHILLENGFTAMILPSSNPEVLWAHFRLLLELGDMAFSEPDATLFCYLALEYKAARSVIEAIITRTIRELPVYIATNGISRTMNSTRLWLKPAQVSPAPLKMGLVMKTVTRSITCPIH